MIHNIGVIGFGVWGCHSLERELLATGRARVSMLCPGEEFGANCHGDGLAAAAAAYASELGAEMVTDWNRIIDNPDVDIVSVMTCPKVKPRIIAAALANGKAVITDKPLGLNTSELNAIGNIPALERERLFMLAGYWNRPGVRQVIDAIESGGLGRILSVSIRLNFMGGIYPGFVPSRQWRQEIPSGEMTTIGSHAIVTALKLIRSEPTEVYAMNRNFFYPEYAAVEAEDWSDMNISFANGALANICVGRTPYRIPGEDLILEVSGTDGYAIVHGQRLEIYTPENTVKQEGGAFSPKDTFNDWLDRLEQGQSSPVGFAEAMTMQRIIDAGIASADTKHPVEII